MRVPGHKDCRVPSNPWAKGAELPMPEDILVAFLPFMFMFCLINIIKTANVHLYEKDAKFRQLLLLNLYALNTNITLMEVWLSF